MLWILCYTRIRAWRADINRDAQDMAGLGMNRKAIDGGGTYVLNAFAMGSFSMLFRVGMAAAVAVAVVLIAVGVGDRGPSAFAQSGGVGGTASCGSGNPLDGRTQGVVDEIVVRLKAAGTLMASETCSDVTDVADLAGITGHVEFRESRIDAGFERRTSPDFRVYAFCLCGSTS